MLALAAAAFLAGCQAAPNAADAPPSDSPPPVALPAASLQRGASIANLTGGDLGIGGGFLLAASPEKIKAHERQDALAAAQKAEESPATLQQVHESPQADLNHDGYITLDEVLAMSRAGMSETEIDHRLRQSGYIFSLTPQQERYLTDRGVTPGVIQTLHQLGAARPGPM